VKLLGLSLLVAYAASVVWEANTGRVPFGKVALVCGVASAVAVLNGDAVVAAFMGAGAGGMGAFAALDLIRRADAEVEEWESD
jgi:hypothetical protein